MQQQVTAIVENVMSQSLEEESISIHRSRDNQYSNADHASVERAILFSQGAEDLGRCTGYTMVLRNTRIYNRFRVISPDCNCWVCSRCGPRNKEIHYQSVLPDVMSAEYVEWQVIWPDDWSAFRKQLNRKGEVGTYFKYQQKDGSLMIIMLDQMGGEEIPHELRDEFLTQAIARVPFSKQPISSSRNVSRSVKERTKGSGEKRDEEPEWVRLDTTKFKNLKDVRTAIEDKFGDKGILLLDNVIASRSGAIKTLDITFPSPMMKAPEVMRTWDSFIEVFWVIGALSRDKGEKRGRTYVM